MTSGYKTSLENILRVLESSGKVMEFRLSNIAGTLCVNWNVENYKCQRCMCAEFTELHLEHNPEQPV